LRTPISGTRMVRQRGLLSQRSSLIQLNGNSLPPIGCITR
jgi:hypothetical protein